MTLPSCWWGGRNYFLKYYGTASPWNCASFRLGRMTLLLPNVPSGAKSACLRCLVRKPVSLTVGLLILAEAMSEVQGLYDVDTQRNTVSLLEIYFGHFDRKGEKQFAGKGDSFSKSFGLTCGASSKRCQKRKPWFEEENCTGELLFLF